MRIRDWSSDVCSSDLFEGREIVTVEGLAGEGPGNDVQQAFIAEGAAQCGYCTPGIVVAATALLRRTPKPREAEIREALRGHLCRCGSHARVLRALRRLGPEGATGGREPEPFQDSGPGLRAFDRPYRARDPPQREGRQRP